MAEITLTIKVDDTDQLVLKNDLLDIDAWVQAAMTGKINNVGNVCNKSGLQN
jgi:predicted transcriptional regulator